MNFPSTKIIWVICIFITNINIQASLIIGNSSQEVATYVTKFLPEKPVIFEAGAYNGGDTMVFAQFWPEGEIHAFEPVPSLYDTVIQNTSQFKNVKVYPYALSDKKGSANFFLSEHVQLPGQIFAAGSLLSPNAIPDKEILFGKQIAVQTITIDQWATEHKVSHIDFMWLDMQGHELPALKHATTILPNVKLIFIEVEFVEAYKDQPLYWEVKDWLESKGFRILAADFDVNQVTQVNSMPGNAYYGNVLFINGKLL